MIFFNGTIYGLCEDEKNDQGQDENHQRCNVYNVQDTVFPMYDLFDGHMDHHVSIRIEISCDRRNDGQHVFIKHAEKSAGHIRAVSRHGGIKTIDGGADMGGWGMSPQRRCLSG